VADRRHRLADLAGPEQLGQRAGVVCAEVEERPARVRVAPVEQRQLPPAVAVGEDGDALSAGGGELVTDADPRQLGLLDLGHGASVPAQRRPVARGSVSRSWRR
jgi:hypothetical protein